ncbi:MAG: hybrid sensor histidine kinase/response regulator [Chloroflexi bacterium]|nr:MAG: hypothetical protein CUN54_05390 [Phototrophicales bacterium]RMF77146.1 MAG: hybrid sensor histidine kinase/response regulator [Chloroflexota bacterium]
MSDSIDAELLNIFWIEVGEYLDTLNTTLLEIETTPDDNHEARLREMNRIAHSMKGAARTVGIEVIEKIAFHFETLFEKALNGKFAFTPDACDVLYNGLDVIQLVTAGEEQDETTVTAILNQLEKLGQGKRPSQEIAVAPAVQTTADPRATTSTIRVPMVEDMLRVPIPHMDNLMASVSELLVARLHSEELQRDINALRMLHTRWQREWRTIRAAYIRLLRRLQNDDSDLSLELSTLLAFLETNQRYLAEANRHLIQVAQRMTQDHLRLSALVDEMQNEVSAMRLVTFETAIPTFQRVIRDLARETNKQIQLDVMGGGVALDKRVMDTLRDPIMHLLRNAVDHGIESADERQQLGKPAEGQIVIFAEQRGSEIIISVHDDGAGIDPSIIKKSAIKRGLITDQQASKLSDDDALSYIFYPGFSTNEAVTAISGRGVGMDIVRDRVESLRGGVSIRSLKGQGTTISLHVPISLTRLHCVMLQVGDDIFAVPSSSVLRMLKTKRDDLFVTQGRYMVLVEGQAIPFTSLPGVLGMPLQEGNESQLPHEIRAIVLQAADRTVAFAVDDMEAEQELILKPLGLEIAGTQHIAGAALLGSGRVVLVLDVNDLARTATGMTFPASPPDAVAASSTDNMKKQRPRVLVVDDSITTRMLEKNILEAAGFDVRVAVDGTEAWGILGEGGFDIVISDVEMPRMNGLELVEQIKAHERLQTTPVILLTSRDKPEHLEAGMKAGADAYLVKSQFEQDELLNLVKKFV